MFFFFIIIFSSHFIFRFGFVSPEFSYRSGLGSLPEDSASAAPTHTHGSGGPPNRPLPPTPDDDDQTQGGDRTLIMKRVSFMFDVFFF